MCDCASEIADALADLSGGRCLRANERAKVHQRQYLLADGLPYFISPDVYVSGPERT